MTCSRTPIRAKWRLSLTCLLTCLLACLFVACQRSASDLTATAARLAEQGQSEEAALGLRKAIQQQPGYASAYVALSELLIRQGKAAEALQVLFLGAEQAPGDGDLRARLTDTALAVFLEQQGRSESLLKRLQALESSYFAEDPNAFQGHRIHGFLALTGRKPDEAIASFRKALTLKPNDPEVSAALLKPLIETGNSQEFERTAKAALAANPSYGPLYEALVPFYLVTNRTAEAEALLQSRIRAEPKNLDAAISLASFYQTTRQPRKMEAELDRIQRDSANYPDGALRVADFHYRSGRLRDAEAQARESLSAGPAGRSAYERMLLKTLAAENKFEEAKRVADEILARDPKATYALTARVLALLSRPSADHARQASRDLDTLIQLEPDEPFHRFQSGRARQLLGDAQGAVSAYQEAIRLRRTFLSPRMALAEMAFDSGDYAKTIATVNEILAIDRANPEPRVLLAAAHMGAGDTAQARNILAGVLAEYPDFGLAEVQLGFVYLRQNRLAEAEAIFRKYYRQGMPDTRPLRGLVEVNFAQRRPEAALNLVSNEMAATRYDARLLRPLLASTAARAGKFDLAVATMRQIVDENPGSAEAQFRFAELLRAAGRPAEALARYEEAARLDPSSVAPLLMAGSVLLSEGRDAEARERLEKALQLQPGNALALNNLAALLADANQDLPRALQYAQKANQLAQGVPDFKDTLAWVYARMEKHDFALQVLEEITAQNPKNPTFLYHRGYVQAKKGLRREARNSLEAALENKPSPVEERRIRELLSSLNG